ncbi:MAG: type IV secretion system DNA-binding domain-containing protein, partial [Terriglobia bacterium]
MSCTSTPLRKPAPVGILCALVLSAVAAFGCFRVWRRSAPPLQAYYLPTYARESLLPHLAFGRAAHHPTRYLAIFDGSNLATDEMLATDPVHITVRPVFAQPRQFTAWLRAAIYHGNTLFQVLEFPLVGSAVCLILLLSGGVMFDAEQITAFRRGRKLRGPDLLSARHFNRRIHGDGLTFQVDRSRRGSHSFARVKGSRLRVEKRHESQHIQIIGDPGSGKTQAIMQILDQAEAQDEAAIIYDPHLEFAVRYYRPDRGDLIANPLDERCFSWCPTDELDLSDSATAEATVLAQAESLYPGRPTDKDWFFIHTSRLIYKHLLVHHQPESAHELGNWMQHPDPQIDMRVLGTEL